MKAGPLLATVDPALSTVLQPWPDSILPAMVDQVKYRKDIRTMANQHQFRPESLDAALDVLSMLKARAADAEKRNDAFTFGLMNQLVKVVSPIVTKAHARMIREEKADLNRRHQELKKTSANIPFKRED